MGWFDSVVDFAGNALGGASFGIDVGSWFGEDRPDEVRAQNLREQERYAKEGIQWRVADARKAGLHPLSALGSAGSAFQSQPISIGPESSINLGTAVQGLQERRLKEQHTTDTKAAAALAERESNRQHALALSQIATETERQAELRSQVRRNEAEARHFDEQVRASQGAKLGNHSSSNKQGAVLNPQFQKDAVQYKPDQVTSTKGDNPAITAGGHAMFQERTVTPGGAKMLVFADSDPAESFEGVGATVALLIANGVYYGKKGIDAVLQAQPKARKLYQDASVRKQVADGMRSVPRGKINVVRPYVRPDDRYNSY